MSEQTYKQPQMPVDYEQECCELYAEYCYPCRTPTTKQQDSQQTKQQR